MKTVVERCTSIEYHPVDVNLNRIYPSIDYYPLGYSPPKSCFYDYGYRSPVEFLGFVDDGDCEFIDELGDKLEKIL